MKLNTGWRFVRYEHGPRLQIHTPHGTVYKLDIDELPPGQWAEVIELMSKALATRISDSVERFNRACEAEQIDSDTAKRLCNRLFGTEVV